MSKTGSIRERRLRDGSLRFDATFKRAGIRKEKTFPTREEAEEWLVLMRYRHRQAEAGARTVGDAVRHYLADRDDLNHSSRQRAKWWADKFGSMLLSEVDIDFVLSVRERLRQRRRRGGGPISAATADKYLASLRAILNSVRPLGWISVNPVEGIKISNGGRRERIIDDPRDEQALLEAARADDWADAELYIRLSLHSGQRQGILLALRVEDVDFAAGVIKLPEPKRGGKANAGLIVMTDDLARYLREHLLRRGVSSPWLFPQKHRPDLRKKRVNVEFARIVKRAGLPPDLVPHCMRHSAATRFILSGAAAPEVMALTGHQSAQALAIYDHAWRAQKALMAAQKIYPAFGKTLVTPPPADAQPAPVVPLAQDDDG